MFLRRRIVALTLIATGRFVSRRRLYGIVAAAGLFSCAMLSLAQHATPPLYTNTQAQQGATIYRNQCAACHGAELEGAVGPALTGTAFRQMAAAEHLTPKTLLDVISQTMPTTAPGVLKPEDYASLVAYILQRSGYPAGDQTLKKGSANLDSLDLSLDLTKDAAGASASQPVPAVPAAAAMRLASAGVYTDAQAVRGKAFYSDTCLQCHGGELEGVEEDPALAGRVFLSHWGKSSVGALHAYIDKTMPPGNGGALGAVAEADVVAYILSRNGFPAGSTPLPADPAGLNGIALK
jgi:S-disulfanyl-L-cysteine oxidoreductase SoxD